MKNLKVKLAVAFILCLLTTICMHTLVFAANENVQILEKSETEYLIYLSGHLKQEFEFAFTNDKSEDKETLTYQAAALDSDKTDANYIAYVDSNLFHTYFSETTYLWARTMDGQYIAEGVQIDLTKAIKEEDLNTVNNATKVIAVDTTNTIVTTEMIDDVKTTKTVGKVDVLESGKVKYQLIRVQDGTMYKELIELAEKISNNQVKNNMYSKLEIANQYITLYNQLKPEENSQYWIEVTDKVIEQPLDSKNGEQYILWLKAENGAETKIDIQYLTCFEEYKYEKITEEIVTKLPVTYDSIALLVVFAILIVALVAVIVLRNRALKKENKTEDR